MFFLVFEHAVVVACTLIYPYYVTIALLIERVVCQRPPIHVAHRIPIKSENVHSGVFIYVYLFT